MCSGAPRFIGWGEAGRSDFISFCQQAGCGGGLDGRGDQGGAGPGQYKDSPLANTALQCRDREELGEGNWLDLGWHFQQNFYNGLI